MVRAALGYTARPFALVCWANPEAVLERTADGQILAMTPTGRETGARNSALLVKLAREAGWGGDQWSGNVAPINDCAGLRCCTFATKATNSAGSVDSRSWMGGESPVRR